MCKRLNKWIWLGSGYYSSLEFPTSNFSVYVYMATVFPSSFILMAFISVIEAIPSSSSDKFSSMSRVASFARFGKLETPWGLLQKKHEIFFGVSSFLKFSCSLYGLSLLGEWYCLPHHYHLPSSSCLICFEDFLLNSFKDLIVAIGDTKSCTLQACTSSTPSWPILGGHRGNRTGRSASSCLRSLRVALKTP